MAVMMFWITATSIIDLLSFILCLGYLVSVFRNFSDRTQTKWKIMQVFHFSQIVIVFWSISTYFNIDNDCRTNWKNSAPEICSFVLVHFVGMWIGVIIVSFACCCGAIYTGLMFLGELIKK
jgi:hypothetical protein